MIIVTGAQRTGTSLAMQVMLHHGLNCHYEITKLDAALPALNPNGFFDSPNAEFNFNAISSKFEAVKLFYYQLSRASDFEYHQHKYLITIRHPMSCMQSTQNVKQQMQAMHLRKAESLTKSLKSYNATYFTLIEKVVPYCVFGVIDFDQYPRVLEDFRRVVPTLSSDVIESTWRDANVHFSKNAIDEQIDAKLTQQKEYEQSLELYNVLKKHCAK